MKKHFSPESLAKAPSRLLVALATGASVAGPAAAAEPTPPVAPPAQSAPAAEPTVAPVIVKGERNGKPESNYKPDVTKVGKIEQNPKDVPQSITIIPKKEIEDRRKDSLTGALGGVSGLTFNAGEGGRIGDNITLRGYVAYGDIYQDGMRDIAQYNREVFNLERIEVLRGAASMIFGRGSTGGVINQVSKEPFLADDNTVNITAGNHDYLRTTADLNKVTGETSAFRINLMSTTAAGDPEGADSKRIGVAPTFRWGIGTPNEFQLGYYHLNYDDTPNYGFGWAGGRPVDSTADKFYGLTSDYQRDSADVGTFKYTHRFNNKTQLTNSTRYGEYKRDLWATTARPCLTVSASCPTASAEVTDNSQFTRGSQRRGGEEHHFFNQTDLTSRFDAWGMKHEFLAGIDFSREQSERWSYAGTPVKSNGTVGDPYATIDNGGFAPNTMRTSFNYFTATTLGLYTQDIVEFLPKWKLLAGVRWDRFYGDYSAPVSGTYTRFSRKDYLWSYRAGLIHDLTNDTNVYLSYGSSFNTSGDLYSLDSSTAKTPPEESRNVELGSKSEFLDGDLAVRLALFHTEKYNERSTDLETPAGGYLLSGKRHTDGWEIEITGHATPKLETTFNFAHMWSNIDAAGSSPAAAATVGKPAGNTPTNSGSLWTVYNYTPNWYAGFGMDGQSKRNPSHNSSNWAPGFVKYDAMLKFEQPKYSLQFNINNIFNKMYWPTVYNGHAVAGPMRTFLVSFEYKI